MGCLLDTAGKEYSGSKADPYQNNYTCSGHNMTTKMRSSFWLIKGGGLAGTRVQ